MSKLHELLTNAIARKREQDKQYISLEDRDKLKQITIKMWGSSNREYIQLREAYATLLAMMPADAIMQEGLMYNGKPFTVTVQDQLDFMLTGI